jgi:hypothetical protein
MDPVFPEPKPSGLICAHCKHPVSEERLRLLRAHTGEWFACETDGCTWVQIRTPRARFEFVAGAVARLHECPLQGQPRRIRAPSLNGGSEQPANRQPGVRGTPVDPPVILERPASDAVHPASEQESSSRRLARSEASTGGSVPAADALYASTARRQHRPPISGARGAVLAGAVSILAIVATSGVMGASDRWPTPAALIAIHEVVKREGTGTATGEVLGDARGGVGADTDGVGVEALGSLPAASDPGDDRKDPRGWGWVQPPVGYQSASLHVRPLTSAPLVAFVPSGTTVDLLGETARGSGYVWARVRSAQGIEGWLIAAAIRTD